MPVFMLAEPVILLAAIVAFVVSIIRSRCSKIWTTVLEIKIEAR